MMNLSTFPKALILAGLALVLVGLLWSFWGDSLRLGRLPGDIRFERENFGIYFPITTSILISVLLSGAFWIYHHFFR